jgi:hypothetical protein
MRRGALIVSCIIALIAVVPTAAEAKKVRHVPLLPAPPIINGAPTAAQLAAEAQTADPTQNAVVAGKPLCKYGLHNFGYRDSKLGRAFSATLDSDWCYRDGRTGSVHDHYDHRLYTIVYGTFVTYDRESVWSGYYNYHNRGAKSGAYVKGKFYFKYCYDPAHAWCPKTYVIYLRNYMHYDGTYALRVSHYG